MWRSSKIRRLEVLFKRKQMIFSREWETKEIYLGREEWSRAMLSLEHIKQNSSLFINWRRSNGTSNSFRKRIFFLLFLEMSWNICLNWDNWVWIISIDSSVWFVMKEMRITVEELHSTSLIIWSKELLLRYFQRKKGENERNYRISSAIQNSAWISLSSLHSFEISSRFSIFFEVISKFLQGLTFLHKSAIEYHGLLTSANCLIDAYWVLKLTNFGVSNMVHDMIKDKFLEVAEALPYTCNRKRLQEIYSSSSDYLPFAPELMAGMEITRNYPRGSAQGDIFSLGYIMFQILFRHNPYEHCGILGRGRKSEWNQSNILADAIQKIINYTWLPAITDSENQDPALLSVNSENKENCKNYGHKEFSQF